MFSDCSVVPKWPEKKTINIVLKEAFVDAWCPVDVAEPEGFIYWNIFVLSTDLKLAFN